jgi:hypothetical protein
MTAMSVMMRQFEDSARYLVGTSTSRPPSISALHGASRAVRSEAALGCGGLDSN